MAVELNPLRLGIASGIIWGLWLLIMGLGATYANYAVELVNTLASVYTGYGPTVIGSIMGLIDGFVCGFVTLFLIAWVYNYLASYVK